MNYNGVLQYGYEYVLKSIQDIYLSKIIEYQKKYQSQMEGWYTETVYIESSIGNLLECYKVFMDKSVLTIADIDNIKNFLLLGSLELTDNLAICKEIFSYTFQQLKHDGLENLNLDNLNANSVKLLIDDNIINAIIQGKLPSFLLQEYIENNDRASLLMIIELVYGKEASNFIEQRPNLNMDNLQSLKIFDSRITELFGKDALNWFTRNDFAGLPVLLNAMNSDFDAFANYYRTLTSNLDGGYFNNPQTINFALLNYQNYQELFSQLKGVQLTQQQSINLLKLIINGENKLNIKTLEELNNYNQIRREYYQNKINEAKTLTEYKNILSEYVTGIDYDSNVNITTLSMSISQMFEIINIDSILNENNNYFTNSEKDLLQLFKYIYDYNDINLLKDIFAKVSEDAILEFNNLKVKSIAYFNNDLASKSLSQEQLYDGVKQGKISANQKYSKDGVYVYTLGDNYDYYAIVTNLSDSIGMSGISTSGYESWFEYEGGVNTISTSLLSNKNKQGVTDGKISYGFNVSPNEIIACGPRDIYAPHATKNPNPFFRLDKQIRYDTTENTIDNTYKGENGYNEVTIYRYNENGQNNSKEKYYNGVRIPDYIYVVGDIDAEHIQRAKDLQNYLKEKTGEDIIIPIVQVNP